jgi:AcrR family transcriptional regulator
VLDNSGYRWYVDTSGMPQGTRQARRTPTRAERRARTREDLVDAAERHFKRDGFHATSLDAIADDAGYTKGAVYSNFAGKEDLFFAVYERRVEQRLAELEGLVRAAESPAAAVVAIGTSVRERADDGWLAVFFEFWAHVLRHPEHRERFAALHRRALGPSLAAFADLAADDGVDSPLGADSLATAFHALGNGLQLERLTRPGEIDLDEIGSALAARISPATGGRRKR